MTDPGIHHQISELVDREHALRTSLSSGGGDDVRSELRHVEEQLDQCWDLLRQRDARRDAGDDPEGAQVRPVTEVEGYLQ